MSNARPDVTVPGPALDAVGLVPGRREGEVPLRNRPSG